MGRRRRLTHAAVVSVLVGALLAINPTAVRAVPVITFDGSPGTAAPPATLGPYTITPFGADPQPLFTNVSGVAGPAGTGTVGFTPVLSHRKVGSGWSTWSHGYTGDVYFPNGATSATLAMPPGTVAFRFYAEPDPFGVFNVTATAQNGTTSGLIPVNGLAGARYFGFYGTGGATIATISVSSSVSFAVGEFGMAVNQPPVCSAVTASSTTLQPPNHKFRPITLSGVTDPEGGPTTLTITGVTQDEPVNGTGDGAAAPDAKAGLSANQVELRAERSGSGDGRVYRVAFTGTDDKGATCTGTIIVGVPHDNGAVPVDSAPPSFDSFGI